MHLIETMRRVGNEIPLWTWHKARLERSMRALSMPLLQMNPPHIAGQEGEGIVRLTVEEQGRVTIENRPFPGLHGAYTVGISPVVVDRSSPWLYHKSSHRGVYESARRWAVAHHLDDALLITSDGFLTESTLANLLVRRDGKLLTPPVSEGLLPGVMRAVLVADGRAKEARLAPHDLLDAEEVLLCNAVRGVWKVEMVGL